MSPNEDEVIVRFYEAFAAGDADTMAGCYHERVHFNDPVFQDLNGPEVMKMWRTLLGRSDDLKITLGDHEATAGAGTAHWSAVYTFSQTGRVVHNEIDATFRFEDGLIIDHVDSFDFWKWTRMALGLPGTLLGWSPIVQGKVRKQSALLLASAD
ncbi:MAG: nuclear transport factor 2 family protein [Solirubrobacterales bacterium]|nr:nuclear transport factor 2 family protein [Solirubrobacterales bacterium]